MIARTWWAFWFVVLLIGYFTVYPIFKRFMRFR